MDKKIRVVVADDSALMRKKIGEILNNEDDIEVVAIVKDGREAVEAVQSLHPDVVTLDIEMPVMNGLDALGYIMSECPTACVMISAFTKHDAEETMKALEFGAVDFVTKPGGVISPDIDTVGGEIVAKVRLAALVNVSSLKLIWAEKAIEPEYIVKKPIGMAKVFAIASSTGGTQALASILPMLRGDIQAGILIVQHMPEGFTKGLADRLNWQSKIRVVEAEDGMEVKPGLAILAKGGKHMEVGGTQEKPIVRVTDGPARRGVKPCADTMMESAARLFGKKVVGIVLTGMGSDGTEGSAAIKKAGGYIISEHESSCVIYGMPKVVFMAGYSDKVSPLHLIAEEMERLVR